MRIWSMLTERVSGQQRLRWSVAGALVAAVAVLFTPIGIAAPDAASDRQVGWRARLGQGEVVSFAEGDPTGAPRAIGIMIPSATLTRLPTETTDGHHCYDRNGDGAVDTHAECIHTHELVLPLPDALSRRDDVPFKWVLLNWNAHGHMPPGVYDVPHFDVHFYMVPIEDVFAIHDGPCGPEFVNCDHFARGKQPVPADLMHSDFSDVDAVAPAMGNHLIDLSGSEFKGEPFTRTWIYGIYGGQVTFWEEMVTLRYLQSRPNSCLEIKAPPAVSQSGYYPTQRCVRYEPSTDAYVVSLEQFTHREAR